MTKFVFLVVVSSKNKLLTFGIFKNQIFGQRSIIFEKLSYMVQLLLKLRAAEVAT